MLQIMRFRLYTTAPTDEPTPGHYEHDVTVLPADRMRAERLSTNELAPSQRGPGAVKAHPESWVMLWLWCAATRLGLTDPMVSFQDWSLTVLDYDRLNPDGTVADRAAEAEDAELVDPTQPEESTPSR